MPTTGDLVLAALGGDRDAFSTLYRDHVGAVRSAVGRHLRDRTQTADATQASFAKALESLYTLRDPERFGPWLLSIARHTAIDMSRAGSWTDVVVEVEVDPVDAPFLNPPEEAFLRGERSELVRRCLGTLSTCDATAVTLASLGFTPGDVASAIGVSHGAAKVLLHRARRRLRSAMLVQLVRGGHGTAGCSSFRELWRCDETAATRHIEGCELCARSVGEDLFGLPQPSKSSKSTTRTPESRSAAASAGGSGSTTGSVIAKPVVSPSG